MIARIRGPVLSISDGGVVVEAGGIGYKVRIPESIIPGIEINQEIILYTELIVRQDLVQLYGFQSDADVEMFRLLISVSHVGPQTGLSILSTLSIDLICDAISCKKPEVLQQVSGLGKKGAERIILELQNKVSGLSSMCFTAKSQISPKQDALLALQSLGYKHEEALSAIEKIQTEKSHISSSELVKEALVHLRKK